MATKAKQKKQSQIPRWRKQIKTSAGVLAIVALLVQAGLDIHFWAATPSYTGEPITSMIIESVQATLKPAVQEPVSKKVYLPDASLVLPPYPQNMPNVLYNYSPSFDGSDAEANVTLTNAVSVGISKVRNAESTSQLHGSPAAIFNAVPGLQVCARGVHVVFGSKTTYPKLQFTKTLADGRTMHVYTESRSCTYDLQPLVQYLRDAQSY